MVIHYNNKHLRIHGIKYMLVIKFNYFIMDINKRTTPNNLQRSVLLYLLVLLECKQFVYDKKKTA